MILQTCARMGNPARLKPAPVPRGGHPPQQPREVVEHDRSLGGGRGKKSEAVADKKRPQGPL